MKLVILDASNTGLTYPGGRDFPFRGHPHVTEAISEADIVLSQFTPFAPLIVKGAHGALSVVEYRDRTEWDGHDFRHGVIELIGSEDQSIVKGRKSRHAEVLWR